MAKLTRNVMVLSTGLTRSKGANINQAEVPQNVWDTWVKEGVVEVDTPPDPPAPLEIKPEIEVSPSPHGGDTPSEDVTADEQLQSMTLKELKEMSKRLGIRNGHLMKRSTLLTKIEALS